MTQVQYILENIDNLGELEKPDFKFLYEYKDLNDFFPDYTEPILNHIRYLFKLVSEEYFPNNFNRTKVIITFSNKINQRCFKNYFDQICYAENGILMVDLLLYKLKDGKQAHDINADIIDSFNKEDAWKYKNYSSDFYNKCDNYSSMNNECFISISSNGRINNLLKATNIKNINEVELLLEGIELGGKLIESYKDDFYLYVRHGFLPVAICEWEDERAPKSWQRTKETALLTNNTNLLNKLNNSKQDIIFYIEFNHQKPIDFDEWFDAIGGYKSSYNEARSEQLRIYKEFKEKGKN